MKYNVTLIQFSMIGLVFVFIYHLSSQLTLQTKFPSREIRKPIIIKEVIKEKEKDNEPYREDIYRPDRKREIKSLPFNYPTRGAPGEYNMVGFLKDTNNPGKLQQLYGRQTYPNSNKWNYYVKSDQYHQIPIPINIGGQECTDETGCREIQNKERINLFGNQQEATIYKPEPYYYNPNVY